LNHIFTGATLGATRRRVRRHGRVSIAVSLLLASLAQPCWADPAPVIHYAPAENLEYVDVALSDRAEHEIDMAAYVLTDWPILQALTRAADRGVQIRIYLDGKQLAEREPANVFRDLAETPGVEIRTKNETRDPMHLKSYQIDGRLLRTGAANFSASGLKRQDNDLIVIESAEAAAKFKQTFEARFASSEALPIGPGQDNNLKHY
jgi:phosphatidylserine/phosphatidylglycerophosphate/cardiolipin synthase-like enzyme